MKQYNQAGRIRAIGILRIKCSPRTAQDEPIIDLTSYTDVPQLRPTDHKRFSSCRDWQPRIWRPSKTRPDVCSPVRSRNQRLCPDLGTRWRSDNAY